MCAVHHLRCRWGLLAKKYDDGDDDGKGALSLGGQLVASKLPFF